MIKLIKEVKLWNNGYVKQYDFSQANSSEEARIEHVCAVARVCRGDKTPVKTDEELYQQLLTEHDGKPGSVFEFIPVNAEKKYQSGRMMREFGKQIQSNVKTTLLEKIDEFRMLTNARTMLLDEINIYNDNVSGFFVFKIKVPQMIVKHILRHRMLSFQEMSERTNKLREYYYCDEFEPILNRFGQQYVFGNTSNNVITNDEVWDLICYEIMTQEGWDRLQKEYKIQQELLNKGSHGLAYTTLWIAGWKQDPLGWDNFFAVRTKKPAQREIIELATVIKQMMEE